MSITSYAVIEAKTPAELVVLVTAAIDAGKQPYGGMVASTANANGFPFSQVVIEGTPAGSGAAQAISDITGLQDALDDLDTALAAKLEVTDLTTATGGLMEGETIDADLLPA